MFLEKFKKEDEEEKVLRIDKEASKAALEKARLELQAKMKAKVPDPPHELQPAKDKGQAQVRAARDLGKGKSWVFLSWAIWALLGVLVKGSLGKAPSKPKGDIAPELHIQHVELLMKHAQVFICSYAKSKARERAAKEQVLALGKGHGTSPSLSPPFHICKRGEWRQAAENAVPPCGLHGGCFMASLQGDLGKGLPNSDSHCSADP